jgi:uncharacterized membrane protein
MSDSDRIVTDYLDRLDAELAGVPRAGRREVLDEIEAHIEEGRAELPADDEAGVRNLLERLGDPGEIAAEARERVGVRRPRATWREIGALILLPFGSLVLPFVGWFVGVFLLWLSDAWTSRDKLIGTLLVPGGVLGPIWLFGIWTVHAKSGSPVWPSFFLSLFVIAPLVVDGYLIWRLRRGAPVS